MRHCIPASQLFGTIVTQQGSRRSRVVGAFVRGSSPLRPASVLSNVPCLFPRSGFGFSGSGALARQRLSCIHSPQAHKLVDRGLHLVSSQPLPLAHTAYAVPARYPRSSPSWLVSPLLHAAALPLHLARWTVWTVEHMVEAHTFETHFQMQSLGSTSLPRLRLTKFWSVVVASAP